MIRLRLLTLFLLIFAATQAAAFDHTHGMWSAQLEKHVRWSANGSASSVDYNGFRADHDALQAYLATLSAVQRADFDGWNVVQRRAFLINAYSAWTIQLILSGDPELQSIRDLGSLFTSPWKKRFFTLFGKSESLDGIEHGLLRGAADYDDPRIHFAVNCASIGCPALRTEAYRALDLDAQMEDQTRRFLRDRSRNRLDPASATLQLSRIFDWYGDDFQLRGGSAQFLMRYAAELDLSDTQAAGLTSGKTRIEFLDYDWALNLETSVGRG